VNTTVRNGNLAIDNTGKRPFIQPAVNSLLWSRMWTNERGISWLPAQVGDAKLCGRCGQCGRRIYAGRGGGVPFDLVRRAA